MKQKLLLDENIPRSVRKLLLKKGLDVKTVLQIARGSRNSDIALRAISENRIILTMDSDFLRFKRPLQEKIRVILIKVHAASAAKLAEIVAKNLTKCLGLLRRRRIVILTEAGVD